MFQCAISREYEGKKSACGPLCLAAISAASLAEGGVLKMLVNKENRARMLARSQKISAAVCC
jgi:hypothetical protein